MSNQSALKLGRFILYGSALISVALSATVAYAMIYLPLS